MVILSDSSLLSQCSMPDFNATPRKNVTWLTCRINKLLELWSVFFIHFYMCKDGAYWSNSNLVCSCLWSVWHNKAKWWLTEPGLKQEWEFVYLKVYLCSEIAFCGQWAENKCQCVGIVRSVLFSPSSPFLPVRVCTMLKQKHRKRFELGHHQ